MTFSKTSQLLFAVRIFPDSICFGQINNPRKKPLVNPEIIFYSGMSFGFSTANDRALFEWLAANNYENPQALPYFRAFLLAGGIRSRKPILGFEFEAPSSSNTKRFPQNPSRLNLSGFIGYGTGWRKMSLVFGTGVGYSDLLLSLDQSVGIPASLEIPNSPPPDGVVVIENRNLFVSPSARFFLPVCGRGGNYLALGLEMGARFYVVRGNWRYAFYYEPNTDVVGTRAVAFHLPQLLIFLRLFLLAICLHIE